MLKKPKRLCLCVFLLVSAFLMPLSGMAQQKRVTLDIKQRSLIEIVQELRKVFDYQFLYKVDDLNAYPKRDLKVTDASVDEVMNALLKDTKLTWRLEDNVILIKVKEDEPTEYTNPTKVEGTVTDAKNQPLPGVTIIVKGLTVGTATNIDGHYELLLPDTANTVLVFSFIGMETKEVKYAGEPTINVTLKESATEMEEVVVTGYQEVDRKSQAGAISVVKAEDLNITGMQSLESMLQGKVPGMMVINRSGLTGTRQRVRVRGTSTLLGNADPVWVVDGIIQEDPLPFSTNDFNNIDPTNTEMINDFVGSAISWLNPRDIESVTVLKDAISTAIYGTKAANGVIVIKTKKGQAGRLSVSYSGGFSVTPRMTYKKLEVMNSKQRVEVSREAYQNNIPLQYDENVGYSYLAKLFRLKQISLEEFSAEAKKLETNNTDWLKLLCRTAFSHNHYVSISGGSEGATYHGSLGATFTNNTAKGNDQKQYTANLSMSSRLWEKVTLSLNFGGSVAITNGFVGTDPYSYATQTSRTLPYLDEEGNYAYYPEQSNRYDFNIFNELEHSGNRNTTASLNASGTLRWQILENLSYSMTGSYAYSSMTGKTWYGEQTNYIANIRGYNYEEYEVGDTEYETTKLPHGGELNESSNYSTSWTWRNQLEFTKVFKEVHSTSLALGWEMRSASSEGSSKTSYGYMPDRGQIVVSIPPVLETGSFVNANNLLQSRPSISSQLNNTTSYYFTASYMYDDRYAFNFSIRGDASNRFGQDKSTRYKPVWAMGFRWNLGYEHWLQGQNIISDMSFRFNFGYQGNAVESVSPDLLATIGTDDDTYDYTLTVTDLPAPELKWEKVYSYDYGIDGNLFNGLITFTFDGYYKKTKDMVVDKTVDYENGVRTRPMNGGNMINKGWDLGLGFTPLRRGDWVLSLSTSMGKVYNEIDSDLEPTGSWSEATSGNLNKDGYPVSAFWAFRFTGLNPENGGPEFDLTGADSDLAAEDATVFMDYAGKMEPDITSGVSFSLRYKTFSLSSGIYFSFGNKQFMAPIDKDISSSVPSEYKNMSTEWLDRWRKPGDEKHTTVPSLPNKVTTAKPMRLQNQETHAYALYAYSTARVVDAWYIRLGDISVHYSVPEKLRPSFLQDWGFSFTLANPLQIKSSDFKGRDPEVALGNQPLSRNVSFSMSVSF